MRSSEILSRATNTQELGVDSLNLLRFVKIIGREFPALTAQQLSVIPKLERLAVSLMVNPEKIRYIKEFSFTFGQEFEADIFVTPTPYMDYIAITDQKLIEELDTEIEIFARAEGLKHTNYFPETFDNIMGWTTEIVLSLKDDATDITAAALDVESEDLSFNAVDNFVQENSGSFGTDIRHAMRIFRYVVLTNITDSVVSALKLMLQQILLTSGSHSYSNISLELGSNLNFDNRNALEIAVQAERIARKISDLALVRFGARFPQLRKNTVPRSDPGQNRRIPPTRTQ